MRKLPPLKTLQAMEAVARHTRFTKAAEELHLTHGAISKQIRQLEEFYGCQLFDRMSEGVRLTENGRRVLVSVTAALDLLTGTAQAVSTSRIEGPINLSLPPAFAAGWLVPQLGDFCRLYPEVTFNIQTSYEAENVYSDDHDIIVRFGEPTWRDHNIVLLKEVLLFPVCSPELAEGDTPLRSVADLMKHTLLHEDSGAMWAKWLAANNVSEVNDYHSHRFPDVLQLLTAAKAGLGIALGDNVTSKHDLRSRALVRPFRKAIRSPFSYYLLTRSSGTTPKRCELFLQWLRSL